MITRDQIVLRRNVERNGAYSVVVKHSGRILGEIVRDEHRDASCRWRADVGKRTYWADARGKALEHVMRSSRG